MFTFGFSLFYEWLSLVRCNVATWVAVTAVKETERKKESSIPADPLKSPQTSSVTFHTTNLILMIENLNS